MPTDLLASKRRKPIDLLAAPLAAKASPETTAIGLASNVGGGFNTGLAQVLGLPVDLVNSALGLVGAGSERPVGGSAQLTGLIKGTPFEGRAPQTGAERLTRRVGEELGGAAVPMGAAAGAVRLGAKAAGPVGRAMLQPFQQAPGAVTAAETGLAGTAGLGAGIAQEIAPGSQGAEIAGQLAGGLGPIAAAGAIRGTARGIGRKIKPTRPAAVEREVAEQLQAASIDPDRAIRNIEQSQQFAQQTPGLAFETGQAVDDAGLAALQKRRMQASPALQGQVEQARGEANQALRGALDQIAPPNQTGVIEFQQGVRKSVSQMLGALDKRIADAVGLADEQARILGTGRSPAEASDMARDELQSAADAFTQETRRMYGAVDPFDAVKSPVDKITASIRGIRRDRSPAEAAANFPGDIVRAFGKIAPRQTIAASPILGPTGVPARSAKILPREASFKDIRAFRSRILDEIRMETSRVPSNRRRVANLVKVRESVDATLDDIAQGSTGASTDAVERLRAANAFHRAGVDKFRKGPVGRVLRKGRLGEDVVPRSATIGEFFRSGKGSRESVDALNRTLGENAIPGVEDFVADEIFAKTVGTNGRIDPQRLKRWMTQNRQPLAAFPTVRQKLVKIEDAERLVNERIGLRAKSAADVEKGALGLVLNRDPETVTKGLLSSGDATQRVHNLANLVKGNKEAQAGLKRAIWDNMTDTFERGPLAKRRDITGSPFLRPESMIDFVRRHAKTLRASGYTPNDISRLKTIATSAEIARRGPSVGFPRQQDPKELTLGLNQLLSRFYGIARGVVSPRFVISEVGSRMVNSFISKLSRERVETLLDAALVDPELAKTLLLKPTNENASKIVNRLAAFLAPAASTAAQQNQ